MESLQIFNSEEFGQVRTVLINNEPYLVGKDVAIVLGYAEPRSAISKKVDEEDRGVAKIETPSGTQEMTCINESGLYSLVLSSKLPNAKKFKRWVTSEVLPSIRKNGGYISGQETLSDDELLSKALLVAQNKIVERDKLIAEQKEELELKNSVISEMQPKVSYYDMILDNKSTVLVTQIAQDYGMSAKGFNKMLKDMGVQRKVGGQWILYQKYQGNGYIQSKTFDFQRSNGCIDVNMTTAWTQKGRLFLYDFLKEHNVLPLIEKE